MIKRILEALLFASSEPLSIKAMKLVLDTTSPVSTKEIKFLLAEMKEEYKKNSFHLAEIGEGYILRTNPEYKKYIALLEQIKPPQKLSQACTEVLAIISYRQPVTRAQIEEIRGVDCSTLVTQLVEKELIQQVGKLEAPGRPTLYGVTKRFLNHFGLKDLKDLPKISD